jgi:hypothetical protein
MSYKYQELFDSRKISIGTDIRSILLKGIIWGGDDPNEVDVFNFALDPSGNNAGVFPYVLDGLNRSSAKLGNVAGPGGIWLAEVEYSSQFVIAGVDVVNTFNAYGGLSASLGVEYQGDTTGKPLHITQALSTPYAISSTAGDVIASGTNLTVNTAGTGFTPDGYAPQPSDIGGVVAVSPSPNWPGGTFTINGASGGQWVTTPFPIAPPNNLQAGQTGGSWTAYSSAVGSSGGSAPTFGNAIGITMDGVAGCDIFTPAREFTVSGVLAPYTTQQQLIYESLVGTVNKASFRNRQSGEVLYMGVTEQTTDGRQFRLSHKFAVSLNQFNLMITPSLIIPFKAGWDYLDIYYNPGTDPSKKFPIQIPIFAYVRRVYQPGDFSQFGFG